MNAVKNRLFETLLWGVCLVVAPSWAEEGPQARVDFDLARLECRLGETVMVPLRMAEPGEEEIAVELHVADGRVVEILRQPAFLAGRREGFARIRTLAAGETVLRTPAGEECQVRVAAERPSALLRKMRPVITSPARGAQVWSQLTVGAEIWVGAPGFERSRAPEARLHLPDGSVIEPAESFPPLDGPFWRLAFEVDASKLPPGRCPLRVTWTPPGRDAGESFPELASEAHAVEILAPPASHELLAQGECEAFLDTPRSERMGLEAPGIGLDPAASGSRFVALRRSRPAWVIQPEVPRAGRYQMRVRARGALAGAAYPSLALVLGEETRDGPSARLVSTEWKWLSVGVPVRLEAGPQWLGIVLANDFNYRNQIVRTADIDRFELRWIPDSPAVSGGSAMAAMMEGGDTMMMEGGDAMMAAEAPAKPAGKSTKSAAKPAEPSFRRAADLRCAFASVHEGETITGRLHFRPALQSRSLRNDAEYLPLRTELRVNGQPVHAGYGRYPLLYLHPHDLKGGENILQLVCHSPCGTVARSLEQRVLAPAGSTVEMLDVRFREEPYDLKNAAWKDARPAAAKPDDVLAAGAPAAGFLRLSPAAAAARPPRLTLPETLTGERRIRVLLGSSPPQDGAEPSTAAAIELVLHQPRAANPALRSTPLGRIEADKPGWHWLPVAAIELLPGPKSIEVRILPGTGEAAPVPPARELALGGISIDQPTFVDRDPPVLALLYPADQAKVSAGGDALVLSAWDDLALSRFEIILNGQALPLRLPAPAETGPFVLPLPTRGLAPGPHRLEVVAHDSSGKSTRSGERLIHVTAEAEGGTLALPYPRAVRLTRRLGFGPDKRSLASLLLEGEATWLQSQLTPSAASHQRAALAADLAETYFPDLTENGVRGRVVTALLAADDPLRGRFLLFAQNHFSTWMSKTGALAKWEEYQAFRDAGVCRFADLLLTSATSPAMMVYLDQQSSLGRQLNENYARELMELHTVGVHGGYSQEDVTRLAGLLTGWGAQREAAMDGSRIDYQFRFAPYLASSEATEVFGLRIPAAQSPEEADDRIAQLIEMLACRPQTARFLAGKFAAHYLGAEPDPSLVESLAATFQSSGGDFARLLHTLASHPSLLASRPPPKLLQPVEFGLFAQRAASAIHPYSILNLGERSGRNLFDRASPDGFPETNEEYADSNFQLQKWNFCREIEQQLAGTWPVEWFEPAALADANTRDLLIDVASLSRLGQPVAQSSREALHQVLQHELPDAATRRVVFASLLGMMPEAQVR